MSIFYPKRSKEGRHHIVFQQNQMSRFCQVFIFLHFWDNKCLIYPYEQDENFP